MQTGRGPVNGGSMDGTAGLPPLVDAQESLMFDHLCRSAHPTVDPDRLKSQAADAGSLLSDASFRSGLFFFLMARRPQRSTRVRSSAASDVYKRQARIWQADTEETITTLNGHTAAI